MLIVWVAGEAEKHSSGVTMRRQKHVLSLRWLFPWKTQIYKTFWRRSNVHLRRRPAVWLSLSPSDCLLALTQARALPPFHHEMPCGLVCTPWPELPLASQWQGATSVSPGRCSPHKHLSPGSRRSACKGGTGSTTTIAEYEGEPKGYTVPLTENMPWLLTTAAISPVVLRLMQASTREHKKKKKVLAAVLTRSYRKTQKHRG